MKTLSAAALIAGLALFGAGCSQSAQMNVNADQPAAVAPQANTQGSMDDSAWASDDINADVRAAQQMDADQMKQDKTSSDAEVKEQQKTAIETPESEGVTFDQ